MSKYYTPNIPILRINFSNTMPSNNPSSASKYQTICIKNTRTFFFFFKYNDFFLFSIFIQLFLTIKSKLVNWFYGFMVLKKS